MNAFDPPAATHLGVFVAMIALNFFLAVAAHEAGHALAARMVGIPIRTLTVGAGQPILGFRLGEILVLLGWRPTSGWTKSYPGCFVERWRRGVYVLGGPSLSVVLAVVFFASSSGETSDTTWAFLLTGGIAQSWFALNTLWPTRRLVGKSDRPRMSDGARLLELAREGQAPIRRLRLAQLQRFAPYGDPPSKLGPAAIRILALIDEPRAEDAVGWRRQLQELARERGRPHAPSEHLYFLDSAVTKMLLGDTDLAVVEDWSTELMRRGAGVATVRGTCGSALVLLGRYRQAKPELLAAIDGPPFDRFMSAVFLARAEYGLGDRAAAERALAIGYEAAAGAPPESRNDRFLALADRVAAEIGYNRADAAATS